MQKIKLTKHDKQQFLDWNYSKENIEQIARLRYEFHSYGEQKISFEEAVSKFGRETVLGAISRAAFHSTGSLSEDWGVESNLFSRS